MMNTTFESKSMRHRPPSPWHTRCARGWRALASALASALLALGVALLVAACGERAAPPRDKVTPVLSAAFQPNRGLIVPVTIGGKGYHFIVDTGASFTAIDNRLAQTITRVASDEHAPATFRSMMERGLVTPNGVLPMERMRLWQSLPIQLGDYEVPPFYPWVGLDLTLVSQASGMQIDGIIGMDIVRQLSWMADNRRGQLTVWRHPPAGEHLSHCVPYQDSFGLSPAIVLYRGEEFGNFRFDTGSRYSLMSGATLAHFVSQKAATPLGGAALSATVNGVAQSHEYMISGLTFDGQAIGRLTVSESGEDVLGLNFLAHFDRYMLVPGTMEFCYEASRFPEDEPLPLRWIPLRFVDGHVELFGSAPDELARYGLRNGDVLIEINGRRVEPSAIADVRDQLGAAPAGSLQITVEREGVRRTVRM